MLFFYLEYFDLKKRRRKFEFVSVTISNLGSFETMKEGGGCLIKIIIRVCAYIFGMTAQLILQ